MQGFFRGILLRNSSFDSVPPMNDSQPIIIYSTRLFLIEPTEPEQSKKKKTTVQPGDNNSLLGLRAAFPEDTEDAVVVVPTPPPRPPPRPIFPCLNLNLILSQFSAHGRQYG